MKVSTKIRRSIRAISPVISVLLMIAIAVAASLVAYAWMMGYIGGTTTKTGKAVLIQSMAADELGNLVVYVQNVGMGAVTVDSVYVGDNLIESGLGIQLLEGETATIPVGYPVTLGDSPKVKVVTTDGTFTESSGTVTSTVNPTTYSITASAGSGGSISPSGSVVVNPGADQTFDITADTGYHIVDVLVDGGSVGAVPSYTFTNVQADHTISATFAIDTHTITASAGTGGTIAPSGSVVVSHGADQGFTISANTGYHIVDVLVDGGSVGAVSSYTFTNVVADHTISASFAINTYTITVSTGSGGTITPPGPSVIVNYGADQAFSIAANGGYHIVDVVVDSVSQGAISSYTFTNVQADHAISATFAEDQPKLVYIDGTVPQTRNVGQMSAVIRVQRQDAAGNPVTSGWTTVNLASSSVDGHFYFWFFDYIPTTSVTIFPGFSYAEFYYRDYTAGTPTLTASDEDGFYTSAVTTFTITVPPPPHYIDTNNVVHDIPNVGSHSSFPAMQSGPGGYDTLTESGVAGAASYRTPGDGVQQVCGGSDSWRATDGSTSTYWRHDYTENHWIIFDMGETMEISRVEIYQGSSTANQQWGYGGTVSVYISDSSSGPWTTPVLTGWSPADGTTGWKESSTFTPTRGRYIRLAEVGCSQQSSHRLYEFRAYSAYLDYQLDLEVQFTGVTDFASYTRLEIQTGDFSGSEDLHVYYWNGAAWIRLTDDGGLDEYSLNTFTVSLTSGTFELRFFDEDRSGDTSQTSYEIDYVRLVVP